MPLYNVHLYRIMRQTYYGVTAESHAAAAEIARQQWPELTDYEHAIEDCEGETFSALVDVVGDEHFRRSRHLAFDNERLLNAAPKLLDALNLLLEQTVDMDLKYGNTLSEGEEHAREAALAAIAEATADESTANEGE